MKMYRKDEGFTLVELMVVVLIIGILVAIAIPVFNIARARSEERTCFANQRTLDGAAQTYLADDTLNSLADLNALLWQAAVSASGEAFVGEFVQSAPDCPTADTPDYNCDANGNFSCPAGGGHPRYDA